MQEVDGKLGSGVAEIGVEQKGGAEQSQQPNTVSAVRAETAQEIAELNLVEFIGRSLRVYLSVLGVADILPNDFNQNLRQVIKEVCCAEDFIEITRSPNIQYPAVRRVLIRLISNLSPNIASALSAGNLLSALQNIVLLAELSRVAGIRIPAACIKSFPAICAFPIQSGTFGELVKKAKTLLGEISDAEPAAAVVSPAPDIKEKRKLPFVYNYREVTEDMIGTCNTNYLIDCSREAQRVEDWEFVERFQREIIRRDPKALWAHINFAQALGGLKRYPEALDERRLIAALDPDDTENQRLLHKLEEEIRRKVPRIERYEDFAGENLEQLTEIDLNSYVKQAMEKRDWQNVLRFAEEYRRRMPNNAFGYIYSAIALEKLGRIQQSLEVREALGSLLSAGVVIELKAGRNAECIKRLKINLLLDDARKAEDAHNWEKSVELRRQLIKLDPLIPENFYIVSFSLERLGRLQESLEVWEKFLTMPGAVVKSEHKYRLEELQCKAGQNRPVIDAASAEPEPESIKQDVETKVAEVLESAPELPQTPDPLDSVLPSAPLGQPETVETAPADPTDLLSLEENAPQLSNIDTSSFGEFLNFLAVAVDNWPVSTKGEIWRTIPKVHLKQLKQAIEDFKANIGKEFPKTQYTAFWKSFDHIYDQIHRGTINSRALQTLIERFSAISAQETLGA